MKETKKLALIGFLGVMAAFGAAQISGAGETASEQIQEAGQDTSKHSKKAVRKVKDKTCTWVKGELRCAAEKAGHEVENAAEEAKDKANDAKKSM